MFSRRTQTLAVGFITLVALVGCKGQNGSFATVSGTVTYNGTPVEGAKVTFHSTVEVNGKQMSYAATTDSSGKYLIASVAKDPGIPAGMYKVTVTKYEGKGFSPQEGMDAGQLDAMASDLGPGAKGGPSNALPKEYATTTSSKLSATLEPGQNQNVNFDLKGK
jgi:hypothetical protein